MHRFGKANPDVEQAQPAAQTTDKTVGQKVLQHWVSYQQAVAGPLFPPGKNHQDYAQYRAEKYKQEHPDAMSP